MTQIDSKRLFGQRARQIEREKIKTLKPTIRNAARIWRNRCAVYFAQFEFVDVVLKTRVVAKIKGDYLSKLCHNANGAFNFRVIGGRIKHLERMGKHCSITLAQVRLLEDVQRKEGED